MSDVQQGDPVDEKKFDEFGKDFQKEIRIPADHSPSALLPPEEIVLVRDDSSKGVVYRAKMNVRFQPFSKQSTNGNGNGNSPHSNEKK
jgi:hypothetical protein